jgi:predicted amidophosphoribosyltransferase
VPNRCYLVLREHQSIAKHARTTTSLFTQFKIGEERRAYPLALGMYQALSKRTPLTFDCVIPVPLSPDKAVDPHELNRTLVLATELAALLATPVVECLSLTHPISKRRLRNGGYTPDQFEYLYRNYLSVDASISQYSRVLLVDDVCDHGSTLGVAARSMKSQHPALEIVAATAGQMIVKEAVRSYEGLVEPAKAAHQGS